MTYTILFSAMALSTLIMAFAVIASPSPADFHTKQSLSLDASSLSAMKVDTGQGHWSLVIKGKKYLVNVLVTADIYTDSTSEDNYELTLTKSGRTGFLVAKTHNNSGVWHGNSPCY